MKRFYINSISFLALLSVVLLGLCVLSMQEHYNIAFAKWTDSGDYFGGAPDEIRPNIAKAQTQDGTTKLIVGDSVCRQLFNGLQEVNPDFSIIGSNGAIAMTGQYILVKEYLDNHPSATDVYLIVLPYSLGRTFDTTWGYQYTVMPFAQTDTLSDLDENTLDTMADCYGRIFLNKNVVDALYRSAVNRKLYLNILADYFTGFRTHDYYEIEIADQYVTKMAELCESRGVNFYLYPCPVCEAIKERTVDRIQEALVNSKAFQINPRYLDMIRYYPEEQFSDSIHFSGEYANQTAFNEKIRQMYSGEALLDSLRLE